MNLQKLTLIGLIIGLSVIDIFGQTLSISDTSIIEPANGNSAMLKFTVKLNGTSDDPFSVDYKTSPGTATPSINKLLVSVDDGNVGIYEVDPINNTSNLLLTGYDAWGMAEDPSSTNHVFFNSGSELYDWTIGNAPILLGNMTFEMGASVATGLAYYDNKLYSTKNIVNEALYQIDLNTLEATIVLDYTDSDFDFGGLAVDHQTGILYGTNDDTDANGRGVYAIDIVNNTITLVTPYPPGETDIDGLAYGNGKLYLIIDQPGSIYVYDIANQTYETPLTSPFTSDEIFSGGAAFICNVMEDYCDQRGSLFFEGFDGETKQVCISIFGDNIPEIDETFNVLLSNVQSEGEGEITIADGTAIGTVISGAPIPSLSSWASIILALMLVIVASVQVFQRQSIKLETSD